jgi:hypothetical protein
VGRAGWIRGFAGDAAHESFSAELFPTICHVACRFATHATARELGSPGAKVNGDATVKNVEGTFPQSFVTPCFAVSDDASVDLIDLGKPASSHQWGEYFAPNPARAIRHDRLVLEIVVLSAF